MGKIKQTEARKRAAAKFHAKQEQIAMRFKPGTKDRWKAAADASGMSLARFVEMCVEREVAKIEISEKTEN